MFNYSRKGVFTHNAVPLIIQKKRMSSCFSKNMYLAYFYTNVYISCLSEFKADSLLVKSTAPFNLLSLNMLYLYKLSSFIFDRRFIYSVMFLVLNKSSVRRTRRYIFQHFSAYFISVSLFNYRRVYGITAQLKTSVLLLRAEYFNILWFLFWKKDWESAKKKRLGLSYRGKSKFQKWFFNLNYIRNKKPISYIVKKLKKNKRKPIVLKNHFNIGFGYGYIGINYSYLLTRRGVM